METYLTPIIVVILLVGVSFALYYTINQPYPKSGKIIEKRHQTKRAFLQLIPTLRDTGMVFLPSTGCESEDWIIVIEDETGFQGEVYIAKAKWDALSIGDHFEVLPL